MPSPERVMSDPSLPLRFRSLALALALGGVALPLAACESTGGAPQGFSATSAAADAPGATPEAEATDAPIWAALDAADEATRSFHQYVIALSDPFFEGRVAGSRGGRDAAAYVAFQMRRIGLEPLGGVSSSSGENAPALNEFVRTFDVPDPQAFDSEATIGEPPIMSVHGETPDDEMMGNVNAYNVFGVLPGQGRLADEWVVIGAHYDHLGDGHFGSRSPEFAGEVHPGADDNASGVAGMLVAAERLIRAREEGNFTGPRRSILFIGFAAEEMGLVGSKVFVDDAVIPTRDIVAMMNLDMIGRLGDELLIAGIGTGDGVADRVAPIVQASGLPARLADSGWLPSDQVSFLSAEIPSLSFFTGIHDDYHTVRDEGWKIRHAGGARIAALVADIAQTLATEPERFAYVSIDRPTRGVGSGRNAPVRLGVRPGEYLGEEQGVLVGDVYEGTSAAEGGVRKGDLIVAWDGTAIDGPGALMQQLRAHEPGDFITLTVLRDGQREVLGVTLQARE